MTALKELIGDKFLKKDGKITTFDESIKGNDLIGLYFSAHWCGPCKYFTPILKESYEQWMKDGQKISIIFGTLDNDEQSFKDYFATHGDYLAFEYGEKNGRVRQLMDKYGIRGIPTLVILNKNGHTVATDARIHVQGAKAEAINEWIGSKDKEKNSRSLSDGTYSILCQHSGKALEIEGGNKSEGAKLIQNDANGAESQQFFIKYNENNGKYTIQVKHSNLYLDVSGGSQNNCAEIIQWSYHGGKNQCFEIMAIDNDTYRINTHCDKSFDISGASKENKAKVLQYSWHGGNNQRFTFKAI